MTAMEFEQLGRGIQQLKATVLAGDMDKAVQEGLLRKVAELEEQYNAHCKGRSTTSTARAKLRAELRKAERYAIGGRSSRFAQAGLPSLGKRRP